MPWERVITFRKLPWVTVKRPRDEEAAQRNGRRRKDKSKHDDDDDGSELGWEERPELEAPYDDLAKWRKAAKIVPFTVCAMGKSNRANVPSFDAHVALHEW